MKNYELLDAIGGIDAHYVNAADQPAGRKRSSRIIRWIVVAACMCLTVGIVIIPQLTNILQNKGGSDHQTHEDPDYLVQDIANLEFNGAYYEATDIPEVLERFGLPTVITEDMAGEHFGYLQTDGGAGYKESAVETDIELMQYAPASCRGVYIIRDGNKYLAALFCNIISLDSNASAEMETLYEFYGIQSADDIISITEVDRNRDKTIGNVITDSHEIATFYEISNQLACYGNDDFQAIVFDGIPEEQQPEAHTKFADDLKVIRIETKEGLRFFIEAYPAYGWIYGNGTLSYYQIDNQMSEWLNYNLQ